MQMRAAGRWLLVVAATLAPGCAARAPSLPPHTATEVERRSGHPMRPPDQQVDGALPAGIDLADGVTEDEAVAAALWNNAALSADLAGLGLARADLIDAGLLRNPSLQMLLPVGAKPFELSILFPLEQLWQRPKRVAAARRQWEQVAEGLVQHGLDTARDARQAWAALLRAQERQSATAEAAALRREIAEIAAARLRAGDISEAEAQAAAAAAAASDDEAARAVGDVAVARARLRLALGVAGAGQLAATPAPASFDAPPSADDLRAQAMGSRPDLRALELSVQAAAYRAKWERSKIAALGAILSSKEVGTSGVLTGPGVSADIPIFGSHHGGAARADAEVEQASRQYVALRQRVDLDVVEAYTSFAQARESLARWHDRIVPAAKVVVEASRRAYETGDVSFLAVLEASRLWKDATLREIDLAAAARQAAADLDRSVGTRVTRGPQS